MQLYLIKPLRSFNGEAKLLTQGYIDQNSNKEIETNIFLDLNILSKIRKIIMGKESYQDSFLPELVTLLGDLRGCYLSPGLALYEAYGKYKKQNYKAFETFLRAALPKYYDAYNSLKFNLGSNYNKIFSELDKDSKDMLKLNYASILCIHYINLICRDNIYFDQFNNDIMLQYVKKISKASNKDMQSILKFMLYINSMDQYTDMLGGIECEIAKLAFFDWSQVRNEISGNYRNIVNNFIKTSINAEKLLANSLNAAMDINYYRCLAWGNYQSTGLKLDNWLLTADKGLKELSEILYYIEDTHGVIRCTREEKFYDLPYWITCDGVYEDIMKKRRKAENKGKVMNGILIDKFINDLEIRIRKKLG